MIGVFHNVYNNRNKLPSKVLDIGAGSNAVAFALGFCIKNDSIEVIALEPSDSMGEFPFDEQYFQNIELQSIDVSIETIVESYRGGKYTSEFQYYSYFDAITISSALAYSFSKMDNHWWQHFSEALYNLSTDEAIFIIVEPSVKYDLLSKKLTSAEISGWSLVGGRPYLLSEMFDNIQNKEVELPSLSAMQTEYVNRPYPVTSWNSYWKYNEHILIFQKKK